jgi:hypothetical protein
MTREAAPGVLHDPNGSALTRLGAKQPAQYLVRPDGHIGFRSAGADLRGGGALPGSLFMRALRPLTRAVSALDGTGARTPARLRCEVMPGADAIRLRIRYPKRASPTGSRRELP